MWRTLLSLFVLVGGIGNLYPETLFAKDVRPETALRAGLTADVDHVTYGASFVLNNGQNVRLLGIKVPKPDESPFMKQAEPFGFAAKSYVEQFVKGHHLTLYFDKTPQDRYGRLLAHVVRDDGIWLQKAMLESGLARVYSFPDNRWGVRTLLSFENQAREDGHGLWSLPYYRVRTVDTLDGTTGSFQLFEGRVLHQNQGRGTIYLNFGKDWKQDMTVKIGKSWRKAFEHDGDMPDYSGNRVRVRGWIQSRNGPLISVTHPEQIELLSDKK